MYYCMEDLQSFGGWIFRTWRYCAPMNCKHLLFIWKDSMIPQNLRPGMKMPKESIDVWHLWCHANKKCVSPRHSTHPPKLAVTSCSCGYISDSLVMSFHKPNSRGVPWCTTRSQHHGTESLTRCANENDAGAANDKREHPKCNHQPRNKPLEKHQGQPLQFMFISGMDHGGMVLQSHSCDSVQKNASK